jgi:16S rRNA (adenine1518-N6/adenine1519-N6)-dimethyltransferase
MTLSEMRRWIDGKGLQLTKSLGQNFLHDGNQLRRIVAAAELAPGDRILEIGPGLGPLTELLVATGLPVMAVEKDARLIPILEERFPGKESLTLLHRDALDWLQEEPTDWEEWKLVANLPYSVGSPILVELAVAARPPRRMVATLQWEVVQRLAAAPDTDAYGLLTVLVGLQFQSAGWFKVPKDCFFPAPDVESACITLVRRPEPLLPPGLIPLYGEIVKTAFGQRRKMLRKLLRSRWPDATLTAALAAAGIPETARAETVDVGGWVRLTLGLSQMPRAS